MDDGYYDEDGHPISLDEFGRRFEDLAGRILDETGIAFPGEEPVTIRTVWLGFKNQLLGAHLFGTARVHPPHGTQEIELYDDKAAALRGHQAHCVAVRGGFHCARCAAGRRHGFDGEDPEVAAFEDGFFQRGGGQP